MGKTLALAFGASVLVVLLLSQAVVVPGLGTAGKAVLTSLGELWAQVTDAVRNARQAVGTDDSQTDGTTPEPIAPVQPPLSQEPSQPPLAGEPPADGFAWAHDPLTVAIEWESGVDSRTAAFVQAAISEWQSLLRTRAGVSETTPTDRVPFGIRYVSEDSADIVFVLKRQMAGKALGEANVLYTEGVLRSARIEMAVSSAEGLPLDRADIQNIAGHEFGHALGLGHNSDPDDLMYYEYQFVLVRRPIAPSTCDVDTVLAGYRTDGFGTPNDLAALSVFACA